MVTSFWYYINKGSDVRLSIFILWCFFGQLGGIKGWFKIWVEEKAPEKMHSNIGSLSLTTFSSVPEIEHVIRVLDEFHTQFADGRTHGVQQRRIVLREN